MKEAVSNGEDVVLDLRDAEWFTPAFLAPVSVIYNKYTSSGASIEIDWPRSRGIRSYLQQIDFPAGTGDPSSQYRNHLPLCSMNTDRDEDVVEVVGSKIRDLIQEQLSDAVSESGIMWINYPLVEIVDNVDYHSDCEYGALLVQNYPKKPFLDICIADDGVSIPGNFERYGIDFKSDAEAVRRAMEEGLSTRQDTGFERGFGLRTTVEMICDGLNGQSFLASRGTMIAREKDRGPYEIERPTEWNGTVFMARLNRPNPEFNYMDYLSPE